MKAESSHRYLAVRRGWLEQELSIKFEAKPESVVTLEDTLLQLFEQEACSVDSFEGAKHLKKSARMALKVYVLPP